MRLRTSLLDSKLLKIFCAVLVVGVASFAFLRIKDSHASGLITMVADVKNVLTGTAGMDADNNPGNDMSADNDIVRSFDTVMYPLTINLEDMTGGILGNVKVRISATVSGGVSTDGRFLNASFGSGWGGSYDLSTGAVMMSRDVVITSTGSDSEYNIPLNIHGATHGTKIQTTFTLQMLEATDTESGGVIDMTLESGPEVVVTDEITVSSKVNLSARVAKSDYDVSIDFDKYTQTTGNLAAAIKFHGIAVSIEPVNGRTNLIGSAYPTDEVVLTLDSKIYKRFGGGAPTELILGTDTRPITVFDYGENRLRAAFDEHLHSATYDGHLVSYDAISSLPASRFGLGVADANSVTNSGDITMTNNADYTMTLSFKDFVVTGHSPTRAIDSASTAFDPNSEKVFLVARFSDVIPMEVLETEPSGTTLEYDLIVDKISHKVGAAVEVEDVDVVLKWEETKHKNGTLGLSQSYVQPDSMTNLGGGSNVATATGIALAMKDQNFRSYSTFSVSAGNYKKAVGIQKWNPNESEFDLANATGVVQVSPFFLSTSSRKGGVLQYGVSKDNNYSLAGLNAKTIASYDWYNTPADAAAAGKISAVKLVTEVGDPDEELYGNFNFIVPKKAVGGVGVETAGTPHVTLAYMEITWLDGSVVEAGSNGSNTYTPTTYGANGEPDVFHTPPASFGDTLRIVPFVVKISKSSNKTTYLVAETVAWTVTPTIESNDTVTNQTITITDTLAKGSVYEVGSAMYGGVKMDPVVSVDGSGRTVLTWTVTGVSSADSKKITYNTTFNQKQLSFNTSGSASLDDKIEISSPGTTAAKQFREYTAHYNVTRSLEYGIYKAVDKSVIELNEEFTYTIGLYNSTNLPITAITGLDVLPKNGFLTTAMNGTYNLKEITTDDTSGTLEIYYTNDPISETADPNSIAAGLSSWTLYTGPTDVEVKALYFSRPNLAANEDIEIEVTLHPKGNRIDDLYVNRVFGNSSRNSKITSNIVKTVVVGRVIEGTIWEDANKDGLLDISEALMENVEVFLYKKVGGKLVMVTENLQGVKFVENGASLIKTDALGNYVFEGVGAETGANTFVIGFKMPVATDPTKEYTVTALEVNSDEEKTSNAYSNRMLNGNYLTGEFTMPVMGALGGSTYIKPFINAGIFLRDKQVVDAPNTGVAKMNANTVVQTFLLTIVAAVIAGLCARVVVRKRA
jgi:conserved repeat domain